MDELSVVFFTFTLLDTASRIVDYLGSFYRKFLMPILAFVGKILMPIFFKHSTAHYDILTDRRGDNNFCVF